MSGDSNSELVVSEDVIFVDGLGEASLDVSVDEEGVADAVVVAFGGAGVVEEALGADDVAVALALVLSFLLLVQSPRRRISEGRVQLLAFADIFYQKSPWTPLLDQLTPSPPPGHQVLMLAQLGQERMPLLQALLSSISHLTSR